MKKLPVGYIEELDAVSISYDGSYGKTIEIEGLRIILPKAPPKTKIWKRSSKKEEQYFERQLPPRGLKKDNYSTYTSYIDGQFDNLINGFWFLNNGEPEYITGAQWMLLQWAKAGAEKSEIYKSGEYFYFSKAQQKLHYFMEAAWVDERSFGICLSKIRRFGATAVGVNFFQSKAIVTINGGFGITSFNEREAGKAFRRQNHIFKNLPDFFKPTHTLLKRELLFSSDNPSDDLNTTLDYVASSENAYDSRKLKGYFCDEAAKRNEDIIEHWEKVKLTQTDGANIIGKTFMLTTIEQYNAVENARSDKNAGSGDKFMYIYDGSKIEDRNENNQTKSGLYKIFISCYEHYAGFIDMYGHPIVEDPKEPVLSVTGQWRNIGIKTYMKREIAKFENDPNGLYSFLRKTPRMEADIKRVISDNGLFDIAKINSQIEHNNNNTPDLVRGNFFWEIPYKSAKFYPSATGRFLISCNIKKPNDNVVGLGGYLYPSNSEIMCIGVDPFKYEDTHDGKNSKGSIHGFSTYNTIDMPQHGFFFEYTERAGLDIFYEDVMMACIYFGCPALIERDIPELSRVMYNLGMQNYLRLNPVKKKSELTADERKYGGLQLKGGTGKTHTNSLGKYIEEHIGFADNDEFRKKGEIGYMPFNATLADWAKFNDKNRTDRDASISSGLAIMGVSKFATVEKPKRDLKGILNTYSGYGTKRVR